MVYLNWQIRTALLSGSLLAFAFVISYIRKSRVRIEDTIFWVLLSAAFMLFSLFPQIIYFGRKVLNIESPANFVFLTVIALLLASNFYTTMKLSLLQIRLTEMTQRIALDSAPAPGSKDTVPEKEEEQ